MRNIWRKKVFNLIRWPALAVGAASTTGGVAHGGANESYGIDGNNGPKFDPVILPNTLNATANDRYAAHRSHRSHGSHRSSSGGGSYSPRPSPRVTPPPRQVTPTPPPIVTPAPRAQPKPAPSVPGASPQDLSVMVVRVQAALMRLGYYNGDIDGLLGPKTRAAITKYQQAKSLRQTGRMDIQTLSQLGISIP